MAGTRRRTSWKGWRSVRPQRGRPWGLPRSGLKAPPLPPAAPPHQPLRAPPLRGLHAYHIFKYIKKTEKKKDLKWLKRDCHPIPLAPPEDSKLPVLKENKRQKKGGKRTSCYTEVLYLGTWKQGCFHSLFFSFQRWYILHWYFFVLLKLMHFCNLDWSVCIFPPPPPFGSFCDFYAPHDFSSVLRGDLRKDFVLECFPPSNTHWCGSTTLHRKCVLDIYYHTIGVWLKLHLKCHRSDSEYPSPFLQGTNSGWVTRQWL